MSLLSDLGTKVGAEFKSHRLRIEALEADTSSSLDNGGTIDGMLEVSTSMTSEDDWRNSPIVIRERGRVQTSQTTNNYAPNLNFHWAGKVARSLYMDYNGDLNYGEYDASGNPVGTKVLTQADMAADLAFNAYSPASGTTSGNDIVYGSTRFNKGSAYNTSTGRFTAPKAGYYHFSFSVLVNTSGPGYTRVYWNINGNTGSQYGDTLEGLGGASWGSAAMSTTVYLNTGDYVSVRNDGNNTYGTSYGHFAGHFLGK